MVYILVCMLFAILGLIFLLSWVSGKVQNNKSKGLICTIIAVVYIIIAFQVLDFIWKQF